MSVEDFRVWFSISVNVFFLIVMVKEFFVARKLEKYLALFEAQERERREREEADKKAREELRGRMIGGMMGEEWR